jgi:peptidoglycan pentaglycine glycine transferase (the first glycine)
MEIVKEKNYEEYKNFIESNHKGHFMQGHEWAKVKSEWKWEAIIERDESGKIIGGLSVLIRPIPFLPYTLMYAPRGPVCDIQDKKVLSALLDGVQLLAKKHKAYQFKIDPDVLSSDTTFTETMKKFGFMLSSGGENFEGIQPRFVFRMNVFGKTEDEMMQSFHSKTRYNIRVAIKNKVEVKICDKQMLDEFLPIMRETGKRDGFPTRPKAYFERMMDTFGTQCRLYMAYYEGKPIAGTIAIQYGDKTWYLYGASANEFRNMMPNYLLQWEMIKWSLETNCNIYDFRGVSGDLSESNPLYGLYKFKKGFNGDLTEFAGEFDLILNKPICFAVTKGLRILKKLRHMKNRRHKA